MAANLLSLPPELLETIANLLEQSGSDQDFFHLRLASRQLEYATRTSFLKAYFTFRYVTSDQSKLRELLKLSANPVLASGITGIKVLCKEEWLQHHNDDDQGFGIEANEEVSRAWAMAGPRLGIIFQRLPKLNYVEFHNIESREDLGQGRSPAERPTRNITSAFATVMAAFTASDLQPSGIIRSDHNIGVTKDAICEGSTTFQKVEFIDLRFLPVNVRPDEIGSASLVTTKQWLSSVITLSITPCRAPHATQSVQQILEHAHLPNLKILHLSECYLSAQKLYKAVRRHSRTLGGLCLTNISMTGDSAYACFHDLLVFLRDHMGLYHLNLIRPVANDVSVRFPGLDFAGQCEVEGEDGYVEVWSIAGAIFDDGDEVGVREGVQKMLDCMELGPEL